MGKKAEKRNIRVEVYPKVCKPSFASNDYIEGEELAACQSIAENIKRHVDDIANIGIHYETVEYCEFCGTEWDADEKTGEPLCCTKAMEERAEQQKAAGIGGRG